MITHFGNGFRSLPEVGTSLDSRLGKEILNQAHADVVTHFIELLVDFAIVVVKIRAQLSNHGAIGQSDEFGVDFVDSVSEAESGLAEDKQGCPRRA